MDLSTSKRIHRRFPRIEIDPLLRLNRNNRLVDPRSLRFRRSIHVKRSCQKKLCSTATLNSNSGREHVIQSEAG